MTHQSLKQKILNKSAAVGVIGLGYVGLPLAVLCAERGFHVTGFGRDAKKIDLLTRGISDIESVERKELTRLVTEGTIHFTHVDSDQLGVQDVYIVCVPTPVDQSKHPDLTAIADVARRLSLHLLDGKLIINESTVAPGMTREEFGGLGGTYLLACSPERIDPGNKEKTVCTIAKIVGGADEASLDAAKSFYEVILDAPVIPVSSLESAEMVKMLENTYRAVNIALVNEFALLAEKKGLDILEIIEAAKSKWSFQAHYPSIGVGGHCIPVDPWYLVDFAKKHSVDLPVVEHGLKENEEMTEHVVRKVLSLYNKGMSVLLYGLTYKKDVKDLRESPVVRFGQILRKHKIPFRVYDPLFQAEEIQALGFKPGKLTNVDMFIVGTDHKDLISDFRKAINKRTIVVDGRNYFRTKVGKGVFGVGRNLL